jgi:hypothetical protein
MMGGGIINVVVRRGLLKELSCELTSEWQGGACHIEIRAIVKAWVTLRKRMKAWVWESWKGRKSLKWEETNIKRPL